MSLLPRVVFVLIYNIKGHLASNPALWFCLWVMVQQSQLEVTEGCAPVPSSLTSFKGHSPRSRGLRSSQSFPRALC